MRMGKATESVRFLDEVDLTFSMDSRSSSSQQMTSMELAAKPIVFRSSYRDINMIMAIINKAIALYGNSQSSESPQAVETISAKPLASRSSEGQVTKSNASKGDKTHTQLVGKARVLMSKEQVC